MEALSLEVGDRIPYLEDDLRWPDEDGIERIRADHAMIGIVVMARDNLRADEIRKEFGLRLRDLFLALDDD